MTNSEIVMALTAAFFDVEAPEKMPSLPECMLFYAQLKEKEQREASALSKLLVEQIKSYGRFPGNPLNPTAFVKIESEMPAPEENYGTDKKTPSPYTPAQQKAAEAAFDQLNEEFPEMKPEAAAEKPTHTHTRASGRK